MMSRDFYATIPGGIEYRDRRYREALPRLMEYRNTPDGRTLPADLMIADSAHRIPGMEDIGNWHFESIPRRHYIPQETWDNLNYAWENNEPFDFTEPYWGPAYYPDLGQKLAYWGDRLDIPIGDLTLQVVRPIDKKELHKRRFKPDQSDDAEKAIKALAGQDFEVKAVGGFVLACSGWQASRLSDIADILNMALRFFISYYQMPELAYLVTVYIVTETRALQQLADRIHGLDLPEANVGYSFRDDQSIAGMVQGEKIGTLIHELFHMVAHNHSGVFPPWLDEGLASLYESTEIRDSQLRGIPNWRGEILEAYREYAPRIEDLIKMDWLKFNAEDEEGYDQQLHQAVNHATARYFLFYLQEKYDLTKIYRNFHLLQEKGSLKAIQDVLNGKDVSPPDENQEVRCLEEILNDPIQKINDDFGRACDSPAFLLPS